MEPNTKNIPIPAYCLGQITCRANALWAQTATLTWTDDKNAKRTCVFSGSGEKKELTTSDGQTMVPLPPGKSAYSIECTFTFRSDPGSRDSVPKVQEPRISKEGRFIRIEIETEDDTDNDNNDTWLTIELLPGVDPKPAPKTAQIDPSDLFLVLELEDDGRPIATGIIVSPKYQGGDFQGGMEYWYLDATQDYSTATAASLQIDASTTNTKPDRNPGDALLTRPQAVAWYELQTGGPDLADHERGFGVSLSAEGTTGSNPRLDLFWFNTVARNLSLGGSSTLVRGNASSTGHWYVAE